MRKKPAAFIIPQNEIKVKRYLIIASEKMTCFYGFFGVLLELIGLETAVDCCCKVYFKEIRSRSEV